MAGLRMLFALGFMQGGSGLAGGVATGHGFEGIDLGWLFFSERRNVRGVAELRSACLLLNLERRS